MGKGDREEEEDGGGAREIDPEVQDGEGRVWSMGNRGGVKDEKDRDLPEDCNSVPESQAYSCLNTGPDV